MPDMELLLLDIAVYVLQRRAVEPYSKPVIPFEVHTSISCPHLDIRRSQTG